jgi:hypothetical protein
MGDQHDQSKNQANHQAADWYDPLFSHRENDSADGKFWIRE